MPLTLSPDLLFSPFWLKILHWPVLSPSVKGLTVQALPVLSPCWPLCSVTDRCRFIVTRPCMAAAQGCPTSRMGKLRGRATHRPHHLRPALCTRLPGSDSKFPPGIFSGWQEGGPGVPLAEGSGTWLFSFLLPSSTAANLECSPFREGPGGKPSADSPARRGVLQPRCLGARAGDWQGRSSTGQLPRARPSGLRAAGVLAGLSRPRSLRPSACEFPQEAVSSTWPLGWPQTS